MDLVQEAAVHEDDRANVLHFSDYLGINAATESDLLWIAEQLMHAPLPEGWNEYTVDGASDGAAYFHNAAKNITSWTHPADEAYKALVIVERHKRHISQSASTAVPGDAGNPGDMAEVVAQNTVAIEHWAATLMARVLAAWREQHQLDVGESYHRITPQHIQYGDWDATHDGIAVMGSPGLPP
jgi:hypothetical protein